MKKLLYLLPIVALLAFVSCGGNKKVELPLKTEVPARPAGQQDMLAFAAPAIDTVRIGFVGLGMRGSSAIDRYIHMEGTKIVALCDVRKECVDRAQAKLAAAGFPAAAEYYGDTEVFQQLCEREDIDLVYLCGPCDKVASWQQQGDLPEGLNVIDLSGCHNLDCGNDGDTWVYGMSEMQRRVLVYDTRLVTVPGPVAVASLLALMPLARNQRLASPLSLLAMVGNAVFQSAGVAVDDQIPVEPWVNEQKRELCHALAQCQPGFGQPVSLSVAPMVDPRLMTVTAQFKSEMDLEMLKSLYEQYYDDHNFVFLMDRPIVAADVENTNKCLLRLSRDEESGEVTVLAVMDGLLKAGVGNAVHAMNLMFGLYECIGLTLKASGC